MKRECWFCKSMKDDYFPGIVNSQLFCSLPCMIRHDYIKEMMLRTGLRAYVFLKIMKFSRWLTRLNVVIKSIRRELTDTLKNSIDKIKHIC